MHTENTRRGFFRALVGLGGPAASAGGARPAAAAPVAEAAPAPTLRRRNVRPTSIPDVRA